MEQLQTITLGNNGDYKSVICRGYVRVEVFNQALLAEGWLAPGNYRQKDLDYTYGKENPDGSWQLKVNKKLTGAEPITLAKWD